MTADLKGVVLTGRRYRNHRTGRVVWVIAIHDLGQGLEVSFRYEGHHERTSCWPIAEFVDSFRLIDPLARKKSMPPEGGDVVSRPGPAGEGSDKGA